MTRFVLTLLVSLALVSPSVAGTRSITIVLPTDYAGSAPALKLAIDRELLGLTPGSTLTVVSALPQTAVATVALPAESRYANMNVKARFENPAARAIGAFIDGYATARPAPSALPSQVALPVSIDAIATNFLSPADDRRIFVVGSARYEDAREPSYSMRNAVPGDGLIAASVDKSPYGVANRHDLLAGVKVHYCLTETPAAWASPVMAARTERFWSLYIQGLGGELVTYTPDTATCFDRLTTGAAAPAHRYELDKDDKRLTMYSREREHASVVPVPVPTITHGTVPRVAVARAATGRALPSERSPAPKAGMSGMPLHAGRSTAPARSVLVSPTISGVKKNGPA